MRDPFATAKQKNESKRQISMMMLFLQLKEKPALEKNLKYIECTQQVMPFTYTSQHSKIRKVEKKDQT